MVVTARERHGMASTAGTISRCNTKQRCRQRDEEVDQQAPLEPPFIFYKTRHNQTQETPTVSFCPSHFIFPRIPPFRSHETATPRPPPECRITSLRRASKPVGDKYHSKDNTSKVTQIRE